MPSNSEKKLELFHRKLSCMKFVVWPWLSQVTRMYSDFWSLFKKFQPSLKDGICVDGKLNTQKKHGWLWFRNSLDQVPILEFSKMIKDTQTLTFNFQTCKIWVRISKIPKSIKSTKRNSPRKIDGSPPTKQSAFKFLKSHKVLESFLQ